MLSSSSQVVLIGPYEHHSNILPWKESGATVYTIKQNKYGQIDLKDLEDRILVCEYYSINIIEPIFCKAVLLFRSFLPNFTSGDKSVLMTYEFGRVMEDVIYSVK